jgi:hypothetical protein
LLSCASKIRVPAIDPALYSINSWVNVSDSILPKAEHGMICSCYVVLFDMIFKSASACVVTALALWMPFRIEGGPKPVMALTLYQHHL